VDAGGVIYSWQELSLSSCGPARRLYVIDVQAELGITPNRDTSEKEGWSRGLWLNRSYRDPVSRNELRDVLGVRSLESKVRFADEPPRTRVASTSRTRLKAKAIVGQH
jgi:hypothetical protein